MMNQSENIRKSSKVKISLAKYLTNDTQENSRKSKVCKCCNWKRVSAVSLFVGGLISTCVLLAKHLHLESDSVCYPRLGCFIVSGPWSERPGVFNFFPQSPNVINTTLIITSRNDPNGTNGSISLPSQSLELLESVLLEDEDNDLVFFIIHGYTDDSTTWMQGLKRTLLDLGNIPVILVDWRSGASGYYPQVVANTRVVAREISLFINQFSRQNSFNLSSKRIHLVGHSLGAQIASYVGKAFQESQSIFQITALDPAFPLFEGLPPEIRLHKDDATNVLVIHSNVGPWGLGMKDPVGTVDLYLNNGRDQRGCIPMHIVLPEPVISETKTISVDSITNVIKDLVACSHRRAYEVLEDILINSRNDSESFIAYPVDIKHNDNDPIPKTVQHSFCNKEDNQDCWKLEFSEQDSFFRLPENFNGTSFFMPTTDKSPFCVRYALLDVRLRPPSRTTSSSSFLKSAIDYEITISYDAFGHEVEIHRGNTFGLWSIQAWVEFPCATLINGESKEMKVTVSYASLSKNTKIPPEEYTIVSKLYWDRAKLSFYDRTKDKIFHEWLRPSKFTLGIPADTCFKLGTTPKTKLDGLPNRSNGSNRTKK